MTRPPCDRRRATVLAAALCIALLAGGCTALRPAATPPVLYSLDAAAGQRPLPPQSPDGAAPTLVVSLPHAAAGFDTQRMIYLQRPQELQHFAQAQWVETPPRMLGPLLVDALKTSGAFAAVVQAPSSAVGDLRLDTEIVRLQHEFIERPSRVRFTLRASLVDADSRHILGWREFDAQVAAPSDDPYGGVLAAGQAVAAVLEGLSRFCSEAAARRPAN